MWRSRLGGLSGFDGGRGSTWRHLGQALKQVCCVQNLLERERGVLDLVEVSTKQLLSVTPFRHSTGSDSGLCFSIGQDLMVSALLHRSVDFRDPVEDLAEVSTGPAVGRGFRGARTRRVRHICHHGCCGADICQHGAEWNDVCDRGGDTALCLQRAWRSRESEVGEQSVHGLGVSAMDADLHPFAKASTLTSTLRISAESPTENSNCNSRRGGRPSRSGGRSWLIRPRPGFELCGTVDLGIAARTQRGLDEAVRRTLASTLGPERRA